MLAGLLDGIFLNVRENIDHMRQLIPVETGYISGGMTNMPIINQMQADAYGIPLYRLKDTASQGVYPSFEEAFSNAAESSVDHRYDPDVTRSGKLSSKYLKMKEMYRRIYNIE